MSLFFNPFVFIQSLKLAVGQLLVLKVYDEEIKLAKDYKNKVEYILPFIGKWMVIKGGIDKKDSHSWNVLNQRYAYDFIIVDITNKSFLGNGKKLSDYYCFNENIVAPANGIIIEVNQEIKDYTKVV